MTRMPFAALGLALGLSLPAGAFAAQTEAPQTEQTGQTTDRGARAAFKAPWATPPAFTAPWRRPTAERAVPSRHFGAPTLRGRFSAPWTPDRRLR